MYRRRFRAKPLLRIMSVWKRKCKYPVALNVPMTDGRIVRYEMATVLPKPHAGDERGWILPGRQIVGYKYKTPFTMTSRKRRSHTGKA